jgi:hypothetical protein
MLFCEKEDGSYLSKGRFIERTFQKRSLPGMCQYNVPNIRAAGLETTGQPARQGSGRWVRATPPFRDETAEGWGTHATVLNWGNPPPHPLGLDSNNPVSIAVT